MGERREPMAGDPGVIPGVTVPEELSPSMCPGRPRDPGRFMRPDGWDSTDTAQVTRCGGSPEHYTGGCDCP